MRIAAPGFEEERRRFSLVFTCEGCAHFDPERVACAHGYPTDAHRLAVHREGAPVTFCKEFDAL